MKPKSANGVEGHLIYTGGPNRYVFRVYTGAGKFTDYDLFHSDLCVTINDPDAYFYRCNENNVLDHAPATLGVKE
jgi:hypothetical protein